MQLGRFKLKQSEKGTESVMSEIEQDTFDSKFDHQGVENSLSQLWEKEGIYKYDPTSAKPTFSIDTPPPYVSAAHLHVGHAMSYSQAEFIVRYKRMKGFNVFYPMGFDDNGLPTERFVEQTYNIDKRKTTRKEFRQLCIEETTKGAKTYEKMWRALGLSVDWRLRYSTIDDHCRKTSQKSFLDLYKKGLIYRSDQPVLWDTHFETSLAQADLDSIERKGKLYDIEFRDENGSPLVISTTRPELIPACVGLFYNPQDERYQHLKGQKAVIPLFGHSVPVLASEDVALDFGTGLMMVCTFGDGEDIKKWKAHSLETRLCIEKDGKLNQLAGKYAGLRLEQARSEIVKDLKSAELVLKEQSVKQNVSVGERSNVPVEYVMTPQWFINLMDKKGELLSRSSELNWFPEHMKVRLDQWIEGLKFDWNISRQRFYGVPFPLWHVKETGDIILADEKDLPIDPLEDAPPAWALEKYKGLTIEGEPDVMDTWMTSSLSPLINSNWAESENRLGSKDIYPMSLRVQAFEIIRTWLFYTLAKSHLHTDSLPWQDVMISGWGLNEQGKKVSKRDLEQYTDKNGYNRYDPYSVVQKYGADALRYWAAGSRLGNDLRFNESDVKAGRKIVTKLWNVARMCTIYLRGYDPDKDFVAFSNRSVEDRWLMSRLNKLVTEVSDGFESYDYAIGREAMEKFFWGTYCDNYLEIIKDKFWRPELYSEEERKSAQTTLQESLRTMLGLYAPYMPFVTDELYQRVFAGRENNVSIHATSWPTQNKGYDDPTAEKEMDTVVGILEGVRQIRSQEKVGAASGSTNLVIDMTEASEDIGTVVRKNERAIMSATRCKEISYGQAERPVRNSSVKIDLVPC